jgi:hypothetical protein
VRDGREVARITPALPHTVGALLDRLADLPPLTN